MELGLAGRNLSVALAKEDNSLPVGNPLQIIAPSNGKKDNVMLNMLFMRHRRIGLMLYFQSKPKAWKRLP